MIEYLMTRIAFLLYGIIIATAIFSFSYVLSDLETKTVLFNECKNLANTIDNINFSEKEMSITFEFKETVDLSLNENVVKLMSGSDESSCATTSLLKSKEWRAINEITLNRDIYE